MSLEMDMPQWYVRPTSIKTGNSLEADCGTVETSGASCDISRHPSMPNYPLQPD